MTERILRHRHLAATASAVRMVRVDRLAFRGPVI